MNANIDINTDEILKKFDSLNLKNQKKAAKQAIRLSLNVLIKQAKKNLQKVIKGRITQRTTKGRKYDFTSARTFDRKKTFRQTTC